MRHDETHLMVARPRLDFHGPLDSRQGLGCTAMDCLHANKSSSSAAATSQFAKTTTIPPIELLVGADPILVHHH